MTALKYIEMFEQQLDAIEMEKIQMITSETGRYTMFFLIWSLKEAFIKAIGLGLGYNLQDVMNFSLFLNLTFKFIFSFVFMMNS